MRIAMLADSPDLESGAVQRSIGALITELRKRGHNVLLVAPAPAGAADSSHDPDLILLPAMALPPQGAARVCVPWNAAFSERLSAARVDVVHVHQPLLTGGVALRLARQCGAPLVFTVHESDAAGGGGYRPSFLRRLSRELTIDYCRLVDAVIAPNQPTAAWLHDHGVEALAEIAPAGVDLTCIAGGDGASIRSRLGIPVDAFVVGHAGDLEADASHGFLRQALRKFLARRRSVWCLLFDVGYPKSRSSASDAAGGRLKILDRSHGLDPRDFYAAIDLFVAASQTQLQSLELVEALASGVPVVARDSPAARDVIRDGENGRLLASGTRRSLLAAIEEFAAMPDPARAAWRDNARRSVARLGSGPSAERIIGIYTNVIGTAGQRHADGAGTAETEWDAARDRLQLEWNLWRRRAHAARQALWRGRHPARVPLLGHAINAWRTVRAWVSRREWSVRLLDLPVSEGTSDEPGLIVLQIDGLSRPQLERALRAGRMPFLRRLLTREGYHLHTMYPGLPTTTPAVLGELFWGVEQAVPAFGFRDHRTGDVVEMFQPGIASRVQHELSQVGEGLLAEGTAYSVIYSGGASESSFCPATTGWRNIEDAAMWRRIALFLFNAMSLARIAGLAVFELGAALYAGFRGILRGHDLLREVLYVPRRVVINVVLRELLAISAEADATRGVPVVYANFLGYDENAHRRGPETRFAHQALRGIDRAAHRIWNAAHASFRRNYHVWILADHGQERSVPYSELENRTITEAVHEVFQGLEGGPRPAESREARGAQTVRAEWLRARSGDSDAHKRADQRPVPTDAPLTVAIGPLGYVYWPGHPAPDDIDRIARRLVAAARVPLVLAAVDGSVLAWTRSGRFRIPEEAHHILPSEHPFLQDAARDLSRLCTHPDAGTFLISGWRGDAAPLSFVSENGAHGGPGPNECSGFALLPADVTVPSDETFRPGVLRRMAQHVLRRRRSATDRRTKSRSGRAGDEHRLRIVTYNIHGCVGLDGRLSPSRVARVLAMTDPDIVALQEVDVRRDRSGLTHQAELIAHALEMELDFHPSFEVEEGQYGNAILSRLPMRRRRAAPLPRLNSRHEPRAALWVELDVGGRPLHVVMAHLGTSSSERLLQVGELLGPRWLDNPECREPLVLCGDFNVLPGSRVYRRLTRRLRDVQTVAEGHHPLRTWFGPFPLTRIDHVFIGEQLRVRQVHIPRTSLSRIASDHLPLGVDLEVLPDREHAAPDAEATASARI